MDYKVIHGGYMNTFKKSSFAILSLGLLLSAPAHAGFADLYAQAGQAAQNLWAKRSVVTNALPSVSMPKLTMPAISLPAVSLPKLSMPSMPQVSMPTRAQVEAGIESLAGYIQKAEGVMAQYPKTVAATKVAAKVVPVAVIGGYLAKKAFNKYNEINNNTIKTPEDIRREMIAQLDKDLIGGAMVMAVKVINETQNYIGKSLEQKTKVPGLLNFERDLSRYIDVFPNFLGELNKEWNSFVKLAIAHDNAQDNRFADDLLSSFDRLIIQLKELNQLIYGTQINPEISQEIGQESSQEQVENDGLIKRVIGG